MGALLLGSMRGSTGAAARFRLINAAMALRSSLGRLETKPSSPPVSSSDLK